MSVCGYPSSFMYYNYEHWNFAPKTHNIFL